MTTHPQTPAPLTRPLGDTPTSSPTSAPTSRPASSPAARTTRRTVLAGSAAGLTVAGVAGVAGGTAYAAGKPGKRHPNSFRHFFQHGVASGDPLPDRVVIWTRVTPSKEATPGSGKGPKVHGHWQVARDKAFTQVVRQGGFTTTAGRDHTVKIDVDGLAPESWYYYRFLMAVGPTRNATGKPDKKLGKQALRRMIKSKVGRTRTAPAHTATPDHLRLGVVSCANLQAGFFSAYRGLAARDDLHAIVHLGDYLYEYGPGQYGYGNADVDIRPHVPAKEMTTLPDYRQRHAQYKQDLDLQSLHLKYPWITTWDDHEVANDAYDGGAENHQPATEGDFYVRRAWAQRAYDEWMPARLNDTAKLSDGTRLYRRIRFGTLAEISLLDLRTYRSKQVGNINDPAVNDPARTITGDAQMQFLKDGLSNREVQWKVVGNPVMIAPVTVGGLPKTMVEATSQLTGADGQPYNVDQWDGYTADRAEVFNHITSNGIKDALFITGDIHSAWACELPVDKGTYDVTGASVGVEFVGTSVTSNNLKDILNAPPHTASRSVEEAFKGANHHIKYLNFDDHGFSVLDLTAARAQMDWYVIGDRAVKDTPITYSVSYLTRTGTAKVEAASGPVA